MTETDLAVERHTRDDGRWRAFPATGSSARSSGRAAASAPPATWYVDPIDGTTNFVHGLPWSSFSLAVVDEAGPAAGVVVDPYRREVLSAVRGRGARLDGEPSRCSDATTLVGGIVLTELMAQSLVAGDAAS